MKVVCNILDKDLGVEVMFVRENYFKSSLENFQPKVTPF